MAVTVTFSNAIVQGDFQTNTYETNDQLSPDVLGLSNGGFVCAYNNDVGPVTQNALNFYDADRNVIGSYQAAADSFDTDAIGQPKLAQLTNGNVLVVWDDNNTTNSGAGLRGSIFTATGGAVSLDIDLSPVDNTTVFAAVDVCALDSGGFVVSFEHTSDIYRWTYDSAGVIQGGATATNTTTTGIQTDSQIALLADGAYVMAWTDTNPADQLVKARIYEANGTARTVEFNASPGIGDNTQPSIAALRNGGFVVAYTDTGWDEGGVGTGAGITLQLIQADGTLGTTRHVNDITAGDESDADVTVLSNGFIAVSWTHAFSATDKDTYARVYNAAGVAVTGVVHIADGGNDEWFSAISSLGDGRFITSWRDETPDADEDSIASQVNEIRRTVTGDGAADSFTGDGLRDLIFGWGGADTLKGGAGNDTIDGGSESDSLDGGAGNDLVQGGFQGDTLNGGDGNDLIYGNIKGNPSGSSSADLIDGGLGDDRVQGSAGDDTVVGGENRDALFGGGGVDRLTGDRGYDTIKGQIGDDILEGGFDADTVNGGVGDDLIYGAYAANLDGSSIDDVLNGGNGADTATGSGGDDRLYGLGGKDVLSGRGGEDSIDGGDAKDFIRGGAGADELTGGAEVDIFIFEALSDSAAGFSDVITDLELTDVISLVAIDAKVSNGGDQKFELVEDFTGAEGQLIVDYQFDGPYFGKTLIQGDVNGDELADFIIVANGNVAAYSNFAL